MYSEEIRPVNYLTSYVESYSFVEESKSISIYPEGIFHLIISPAVNSNYQNTMQTRLIPLCSQVQELFLSENSILIRCKAFVLPNNKHQKRLFTYQLPIENTDTLIADNFKQEEINKLAERIIFDNFKIDWQLREYINYILERRGHVSIEEMSSVFDVSRQSIHRKFSRTIQIGPKKLATIWKLNNFVYLFQNGLSAVEAAIDAGYYDQSHLINDFRRVYGQSPNQLFKSNSKIFVDSIDKRFNKVYDPCQ